VFTLQSERVVAKDNTVAIADRSWQLEKTRFRNSLAGSTVTIHEHLDGTVSIRFGPHVVGRYSADGQPRQGKPRQQPESCGKGGTTAPTTTLFSRRKIRKPASASRRGTAGVIT
jgi:hypothetical protein